MEVSAKSQVKVERRYTGIIVAVVVLIIVILALILALYFSKNRVLILSRAYGSGNQVELANSYLFASPLKAKAGSSERVRVSVYVLDSQGKGVFGRNVILGESDSIRVLPVQPTTDLIGRAVFDVAGSVSGYYVLEAKVDGKVIPQRVGLTFN